MSALDAIMHHAQQAVNDPEYLAACQTLRSALPDGWTLDDMRRIYETPLHQPWKMAAREAMAVVVDHARKVGEHVK